MEASKNWKQLVKKHLKKEQRGLVLFSLYELSIP